MGHPVDAALVEIELETAVRGKLEKMTAASLRAAAAAEETA